jgi:hypothetical protein
MNSNCPTRLFAKLTSDIPDTGDEDEDTAQVGDIETVPAGIRAHGPSQ